MRQTSQERSGQPELPDISMTSSYQKEYVLTYESTDAQESLPSTKTLAYTATQSHVTKIPTKVQANTVDPE